MPIEVKEGFALARPVEIESSDGDKSIAFEVMGPTTAMTETGAHMLADLLDGEVMPQLIQVIKLHQLQIEVRPNSFSLVVDGIVHGIPRALSQIGKKLKSPNVNYRS